MTDEGVGALPSFTTWQLCQSDKHLIAKSIGPHKSLFIEETLK